MCVVFVVCCGGYVTPNLVPPKVVRRGCLLNTNSIPLGFRVRVGLGFSIDETIGGQLTAGDHSRHYKC